MILIVVIMITAVRTRDVEDDDYPEISNNIHKRKNNTEQYNRNKCFHHFLGNYDGLGLRALDT